MRIGVAEERQSQPKPRLALCNVAPEEGFEFYRCTNDDERLLCIRQLVLRWIPPEHVAFRSVWQQRGSSGRAEISPSPVRRTAMVIEGGDG